MTGSSPDGVWVGKYGLDGNEIWERTYVGSAIKPGNGIATTGEGGFLVTAVRQASGHTNVWLRGYTADGELEFTRSLGSGDNEQGYGMAIGGDGKVAVSASRQSSGGNSGLAFVLDGEVREVTYTPDLGDAYAYDVAIDGRDHTILVGDVLLDAANYGWVRAHDMDGELVWEDRNVDGVTTHAYAVAVDAADRVAVVGTSGNDIWVRLYEPSGTHQWTRSFGDDSADHGRGVAFDARGNVVIVGYTFVDGSFDLALAKLAADGTSLWEHRLDLGSGGLRTTDRGHGVAVDPSGDIFVSGSAGGNIWLGRFAP